MPEMHLKQIGVAHTPYQTVDDAPHQGFVDDTESTLEIFEKYANALSGIEHVHRVTVIYWAHLADRDSLTRSGETGAFTRRTLYRPNPLSICTCMVLRTDERRVHVRGLDLSMGHSS